MKKWIWFALGGAVLVTGGVTFAIVLTRTNDVKASTFTLDGTWQIFEQKNADQGVEYFVFKGDTVTDYIDGEAKGETKFTLSDTNNTMTQGWISFASWKKKFAWFRESVSQNIVNLYEENGAGYAFCRVKDDDYLHTSVYSTDGLSGNTFDVLIHAGDTKDFKESLVFHDGSAVSFFREGQPYKGFDHVDYSLSNNVLTVSNMRFYVNYLVDKEFRMTQFETDPLTGERLFYVWELIKR